MTKYMTINHHKITIHESQKPVDQDQYDMLKSNIKGLFDPKREQQWLDDFKKQVDHRYFVHLADLFDIDDPKQSKKFNDLCEKLGEGHFTGFWRTNKTCYGVANFDDQSALTQLKDAVKYIYHTMKE